MNKEKKKWYDVPGKIKNIIHKKSKEVGPGLRKLVKKEYDGSTKTKDIIDRFVASKIIQAEERNASKNALEILKKNGATKKELEKAKEALDLAGKSYKTMDRAYKEAAMNKITIPSRRGHEITPPK